jgi:adenosylcobinamide kinase/adenosylcobinamide-phosphate guanylyltransferase
MGWLVFILGGARSGKSDHAQRLARARSGPVLFVATAQPMDDEMKRRIAAHRHSRPSQWETLELPTGVGRHMLDRETGAGVVLLDCLTLLISNMMLQAARDGVEPDEKAARQAVEDEIELLTQAIRRSDSEWIVVSNEVGQGVVPAYASGRLFRDLLGWVNKEMARQADEVLWMVAGIPVPITQHRLSQAE